MTEEIELDDLPAYQWGDRVAALEGTLPDGRMVVRLADGSHAVAVPLPQIERERECSTSALRAWKAKIRDDDPRHSFLDLLIFDDRTEEFWAWVRTIKPAWWRNVSTTTDLLRRATMLPQKPGNLSPRQREDYFKRIRELAYELHEMLCGTRFAHAPEDEISDEKLSESLEKALGRWGEDEPEEGRIVAFRVHSNGVVNSLDYDFPESALTDTLFNLIAWTTWDDHWGRSIFHSSAPIRQANSRGTRANYFACTVWQWFHDHGVSIPAGVLANIADVCLQTGPDDPIAEDSVKKQIFRYKSRTKPKEAAFIDTEGQISIDGQDFVLSQPF